MIILFFNEYMNYTTYQISSRMFVDHKQDSDKLRININLEIFKLPCSLVSIDIQDYLGEHSQQIEGNLLLSRTDKKGKILDTSKYEPKTNNNGEIIQPDYEIVKKNIREEEGCILNGYFFVDNVPGNFHISSHSYGPIISRLAKENLLNLNLEHKINTLSFGDDISIKLIKKMFGRSMLKLATTLDKTEKKNEKFAKIYQYYLKIVPTNFLSFNKKIIKSYQYTYNSNKENAFNEFPTIYFKYDISPITVEYKHYKNSFMNFFINICAIVGGVFTVTGIIDAIIHKSVVLLLRKAELNKLA